MTGEMNDTNGSEKSVIVLRKEVIPCPIKMAKDLETPGPAGAKANAAAAKEKKAAAGEAEKDKVATVAAVREEAVAPAGTQRLEGLKLLRLDTINHQHNERR